MTIKLRMTGKVALRLETAVKETRGLELSGLGFVKQEKGGFVIYDVVILHVGSEGYTEIEPKKIVDLMDREDGKNIKVWFHRHPIGDGKPGVHNWSGLDEKTIQETPLGGIPELVKWSISIVRTPLGWVGRMDNHIERTTVHVPVFPLLPDNFIQEIHEMMPKKQLMAIPIPEKKGKAFPLGQDTGVATEKVTGTTTQLVKTKKTISYPSGEFRPSEITVGDLLRSLSQIVATEGNEVLEYSLVWVDENSNAYPVRFDPMTGTVIRGIFALDEPATVLCVN